MEKMKKLDGWGEVTVGNLEAGKQKRKPKGLKSQAALHNKSFVDYVKGCGIYILKFTPAVQYLRKLLLLTVMIVWYYLLRE